MDSIIANYASSDDEEAHNTTSVPAKSATPAPKSKPIVMNPKDFRKRLMHKVVTSAPSVIPSAHQLSVYGIHAQPIMLKPGDKLMHNPTAMELYMPQEGPVHPERIKPMFGLDGKAVISGVAQPTMVDSASFDDSFQERRYLGYLNPPKSLFMGKEVSKSKNDPRVCPPRKKKRLSKKEIQSKIDARNEKLLDEGVDEFSSGPWGPVDAPLVPKSDMELGTMTDEMKAHREEQAKNPRTVIGAAHRVEKEPTKEDMDRAEAFKWTRGEGPKVPWTKGIAAEDVKTVFHGSNETDYQGRSWTDPPARLKTTMAITKSSYRRSVFTRTLATRKVCGRYNSFPSMGISCSLGVTTQRSRSGMFTTKGDVFGRSWVTVRVSTMWISATMAAAS